MPHGITQCYLPPGRADIPTLTPAEAGTRLSDPGGMQGCTSLQTDNHASTPPLSFLQAGCPSCRPTNSVKALKAFYRPDAMFSAICNYFPWKCTRTVIAPADKSPARSPPSYQACWSALHNVTSANHVLHTAIQLVFMTATGLSSSDQIQQNTQLI